MVVMRCAGISRAYVAVIFKQTLHHPQFYFCIERGSMHNSARVSLVMLFIYFSSSCCPFDPLNHIYYPL